MSSRELNEKKIRAFGENFKHLNEAIGQVLLWQERYRAANGRDGRPTADHQPQYGDGHAKVSIEIPA
jgi:hypothetical protein